MASQVVASSGVTPGQASKVITAYNICKRKADSPLEVVTRGKLRTQSEKRRKTAMTDLKRSKVNGLYFDGRNDKTLTKSSYFSSATTITKKGHYSLVSQPDDNYIGFCTPPSGTGRNIAEAIITYLTDKEIDLHDIIVLGCDGTAANTGWKGGAMTHLESLLGKALQRSVCFLHHLELPLRKLFEFYDGSTTGPSGFSGPVGKLLATDLHLLPVSHS